jgi:hypothetical protein
MATGAPAVLGSGVHPRLAEAFHIRCAAATGRRGSSPFPKRKPGRDRRATAMSELPSSRASFPKTVPRTFSRNGVISTEL